MEQFIVELAKKAGNILLKKFRKDYNLLRFRGLVKEVTTKYDKMSDKFIIKELGKKFPDYNILTEESGLINKNSEFTLIVDSLDGSGNFAVGNPFFSVSIGILHLDEVIFGVTYAPFLKELFVAKEGGGTLLNGNVVHVSEFEKLEECYLVSCEGGEKSNLRISKINAALHPNVKDIRKLGSGAIEAAWVSCGRAEAYITTKIEPWDVAAGVILVREAGGKVTDFEGKDWKPEKSDTVFSNGKIHDKILKVINSVK
jgi:myo-inositol-1(or 4)-monophosphatase